MISILDFQIKKKYRYKIEKNLLKYIFTLHKIALNENIILNYIWQYEIKSLCISNIYRVVHQDNKEN